jgi:hypothetical protein
MAKSPDANSGLINAAAAVAKKKKREEMQKKYNNAPVCKHCNKKHPLKPENECWELEINTSSCPTY